MTAISRRAQRSILWLVLALPGAWMAERWASTPEAYGYGHAIGDSGKWAAWLVMATLAVTPVRLAMRKAAVARWLVRHRRDLGVASFAYAALHTGIYLWRKASLDLVIAELPRDFIWTGWLALLLFLPLALTSNDASMRRLKRGWKRLHRLVYPATIVMFVHWAFSAFNPTTAIIHVGIMAVIVIVRVALEWRQRRARA